MYIYIYKRVHILNLHNYGLTGGQVSCIGSELDKKIGTHRPDPRRNSESFLVISISYLGMIVSSRLAVRPLVRRLLRLLLLLALSELRG